MQKGYHLSYLIKKSLAMVLILSLFVQPVIVLAEGNPEETPSANEEQTTPEIENEQENEQGIETTAETVNETDLESEPVIVGILMAVPVGNIVEEPSNEPVSEALITSTMTTEQEPATGPAETSENGSEPVGDTEPANVEGETLTLGMAFAPTSETTPVADAATTTNEQAPVVEETAASKEESVQTQEVSSTSADEIISVPYAALVSASEASSAEITVSESASELISAVDPASVSASECATVVEMPVSSEVESTPPLYMAAMTAAEATTDSNAIVTSKIALNPGQPGILDRIISAPTNVYNHELAVLSAELSSQAYSEDGSGVADYLRNIGFDQDSIKSYNYDDAYAYTLAVKDYYGFGAPENTKILVMDARGTSTIEELIDDVSTQPDVDYDGIMVYTAADRFLRKIKENLDSFLKEDQHYKILSTGHSLGGAAANLFAAVETQKGKSEVYCYTFGAIDSILSPVPGQTILDGYENIHNIYNDLDTFSPSQYGSYLLGGAGSKYGKFGHMDDYSEEHRTPEQIDDWAVFQIYDHVNHIMDYYVIDTKNREYYCYKDPHKKEEQEDIQEEDNTHNNDEDKPSDNNEVIKMPKDLANVILGAYNGKAITGTVTEKNDVFAQNIQILAAAMRAQVIYSTASQDIGSEAVSLKNLLTFKDYKGQVVVMMELLNTSDQNISLGIDHVVSDGNITNITPWKSAVIPQGKRYVLAIPLDSITSNYLNSTVSLRIYGADDKELSTTNGIRVTPEK